MTDDEEHENFPMIHKYKKRLFEVYEKRNLTDNPGLVIFFFKIILFILTHFLIEKIFQLIFFVTKNTALLMIRYT